MKNYLRDFDSISKDDFKELIDNLKDSDFINDFKSLTVDELIKLVNSDYIYLLSSKFLKMILAQSPVSVKGLILNDELLYDTLFNYNNIKFNIRLLISWNCLDLFLDSNYTIKYFDLINEFLLTTPSFALYINSYSFDKFYEKYNPIYRKENMINLIKSKGIEIDATTLSLITNRVKDDKFNQIKLIKVKTLFELKFLLTYDLLFDYKFEDGIIILKNGFVISEEQLNKINIKHFNLIVSLLKKKDDIYRDDMCFEVAVKLLTAFDFDSSKKLIDNKFTFMNENCLNKVVDFHFKDQRRDFRLNNQNKFYSYGLEKKVTKKIEEKDYEYLYELIGSKDPEYLKTFVDKITNSHDTDEMKLIINNYIDIREKTFKSKLRNQLEVSHKDNFDYNNKKRNLNVYKIKELLGEVDISKVLSMYDQDPTLKVKLINILFGNGKVNNDCIMRMIINDLGMGLNNNLDRIINNIQLINSITSHSDLKSGSVLDLIEILKINLLNLKPNEKDIKLHTITKVVNNLNFIVDDEVDRLQETLKLHIERKKKCYSSIPLVKGKIADNKYYIAPYDAEYLLSAGVDSGNCFKIGGEGGDFFKYCLTDPNGSVVYLEVNDKKFISGLVRSGNGVHLNGIDPKPTSDELKILLPMIEELGNKIIEDSNADIEVLTLTNMNVSHKLNGLYKEYKLDEYIPLYSNIYCDYNKKEVTNFIISKSEYYSKNKYYLPTQEKYWLKRNSIYEYDSSRETDADRFNLIINSIRYSSLADAKVNQEELEILQQQFVEIDCNKFIYIIGNKDWFVAYDDKLSMISTLLHNDPRAEKEYLEAMVKVMTVIPKIRDERNKVIR